jgi:hypothetical protein
VQGPVRPSSWYLVEAEAAICLNLLLGRAVGICISGSSFFIGRKNSRRGNSVSRGNPQLLEVGLGSFFRMSLLFGGKIQLTLQPREGHG